ncbi:hypothetical protein Lal_00032370 [Lupinus albus]|nr:hypothetical protein Lal_00032370 [Lupinus albus]
MDSTNPFGGEGSFIKHPSIFSGEGYAYLKVRTIHLAEDETKEKPKSLLTNLEKRKVQYDLKAINIITFALSYDYYFILKL